MNCPICSTPSQLYFTHTERDNQRYFRCPACHAVVMHPQHYPTPEEEKARYLTHNNDVNDPGYQKFVRPVIQAVTTRTQTNHHGLDYGAGTGPVITKLLRDISLIPSTNSPVFNSYSTPRVSWSSKPNSSPPTLTSPTGTTSTTQPIPYSTAPKACA